MPGIPLGPGAAAALAGNWTLKSGVDASGGEAGVASSSFLSIDKVESSAQPPNVVPEPTTLVLLGSGMLALAGAGRRRRVC